MHTTQYYFYSHLVLITENAGPTLESATRDMEKPFKSTAMDADPVYVHNGPIYDKIIMGIGKFPGLFRSLNSTVVRYRHVNIRNPSYRTLLVDTLGLRQMIRQ